MFKEYKSHNYKISNLLVPLLVILMISFLLDEDDTRDELSRLDFIDDM